MDASDYQLAGEKSIVAEFKRVCSEFWFGLDEAVFTLFSYGCVKVLSGISVFMAGVSCTAMAD